QHPFLRMLGSRRGTRWSGPLGPAGAGRRGLESLATGPLPSGPVVVSALTPARAHDRTRVHRNRSAVRARRPSFTLHTPRVVVYMAGLALVLIVGGFVNRRREPVLAWMAIAQLAVGMMLVGWGVVGGGFG